MKIIRWSGFITFLVIVSVLGGGVYFFAGPLMKSALESAGRSTLQVPVTIESVSLSFSPVGVEIKGTQIPDRDDQNKNLLEIDRAVANMSLWKAARGKYVVETLEVEGMRLDQKRSQPWQPLPKNETSEGEEVSISDKVKSSSESTLKNIGSALPSADEILAKETLQTEVLGQALAENARAHKAKVEKSFDSLPDDKQLNAYEKEIKALTTDDVKDLDDFLARKERFDALKKAINADIRAVKQIQTDLSSAKQALTKETKAFAKAPQQDLDRLKNKYQFNSTGAQNFAQLLFGDKIANWTFEALKWYEIAKPYLQSDGEDSVEKEKVARDGRFIAFPTDNPDPNFWIKQADFDLSASAGDFALGITDLTSEHEVINKPTRFVMDSDALGAGGVFNLKGKWIGGEQDADFSWLALPVSQASLASLDGGDVSLADAQANVRGKVNVLEGIFDSDVVTTFSQAKFDTKGNSQTAKELQSILAKINDFSLKVTASGELDDLNTKIKSNLDSKIGDAFKSRIKDEQKKLEQRLKAELDEKMQAYLGGVNQDLASSDELLKALTQDSSKLKNLAKAQLDDWQTQQKRQAEAKAKQEAEEEEAKLKQQAKEEQEKAEEELKKKLKKIF